MRRIVLFALVLGAAAFLGLRWPLINEVETGRTPGYPELTPREYRAGEEQVAKAVKAAVERLPRWRLVGAGSGVGGHALQAVYKTQLGLEHDVTVKVKREGALTRVGVKSKSRSSPIDLGHNARIVQELLAAIDRELPR